MVRKSIISDNRVICPVCLSKEEFAPAYDYKEVESSKGKLVQFFVRCIHKLEDGSECNCCSSYMLDTRSGRRYSLDQINS